MNIERIIANSLPPKLLTLATDVRCLLRYAIVSRTIPKRNITQAPTLVIAPHPDDETFGCGGLIKLKRDAGVPVRIVLLTDGEAVGSAPGEKRKTIIAARRREFVEACHTLGVLGDHLRYLHLPDGALPQRGHPGFESAMRAVLAELEAFAPAEVYCTHEFDVRPDHIATAQLAKAALIAWSRPCSLFYYPVWMWYHASSRLRKRLDCQGAWRLDISSVLPAKKQSMDSYLDAPHKTEAGHPFCGQLPWSFLRNFRRSYEVYFPASNL